MRDVRYLPDALTSLRRHSNMAARIRRSMADYATMPGSHENQVKALTGSSYLRLRVGEFRVSFVETDRTITVLDIGPRGGIYA